MPQKLTSGSYSFLVIPEQIFASLLKWLLKNDYLCKRREPSWVGMGREQSTGV